MLVSGLLIERNRIVHRGRYASLRKFRLNRLPVIEKNRVLGKHTGSIVTLADPTNTDLIKHRVITLADGDSLLDLPLETLQLGQHDRALNRVHSATNADPGVDITLALAVDPDLATCLGNGVVAGEDRTTVAVAA